MNANDPKQVAKRTKSAKREEQKVREFLIRSLKDPMGQAFLYSLLERCHCYQTPFTADTNQTNFNLGEQNIGLILTAQILSASEAGYLELLKYGQRRNRQSDTSEPEPGTDSEPDFGASDSDG